MKKSARQKKIEAVIMKAVSLIGTPYQYGAYAQKEKKGVPHGVDCSSFIQHVFSRAGVNIPRSSILQATQGRAVSGEQALMPGDLVFFEGDRGHYFHTLFKKKVYIGHVALYCGSGTIIHARKNMGEVVVEHLADFAKNKYCKVTRIRRII